MRMNRFAWQDLIESSNFQLRQSINEQAYESGRRQGLNEQGSPGRGLGKNLGVGSADISRPTTMMGDPAACPVGWGGCGTEGGPHPCAPGSDCAPCANGAEHCRSDRKAGAGCYFVWIWSGGDPAAGGGWNESLICADGPGGGPGGGMGGGMGGGK
jgi:hypothetical protein